MITVGIILGVVVVIGLMLSMCKAASMEDERREKQE